MLAHEELALLIKSKYPLIVVESIDEEYVVNELRQIAGQLGLILYQWSVTTGLRRGRQINPYYQTNDPEKMIRTAFSLHPDGSESGLFVLIDFDKHLENTIVLRLFKDWLNRVKNTKNTIILIGPECKLPKDIEPEAGHIVGGFPDEKEIASILKETFNELIRNVKGTVSLNLDEMQRMIKALKGLSGQQIRNVVNQCFIEDRRLDIRDLETIESSKRKIFDQEGLLDFSMTETRENIANFDNLKRWLRDRTGQLRVGIEHSSAPARGPLDGCAGLRQESGRQGRGQGTRAASLPARYRQALQSIHRADRAESEKGFKDGRSALSPVSLD